MILNLTFEGHSPSNLKVKWWVNSPYIIAYLVLYVAIYDLTASKPE